MVSKMRNVAGSQVGRVKYRGKCSPQVEALYVALMCFTTHCLSCVALEIGGRNSSANPATKSTAFNALFRRTYNLKIIVLVTHIIAGLINTLMMALGDRYEIPYLYLPWLVNTMEGMALREGPALFNLARVLLPNVTFPTATFTVITFLLYVEEFFVWSEMFKKFLRCWKIYHNRKGNALDKKREKISAGRKKQLLRQGDVNNNVIVGIEKLKLEKAYDILQQA